mmetsp:Transcript_5374/g.11802  ORF Transcript_5374/g.11802 Transcript_5374/m.11802 type:complete len:374 (-) Transcript_5374:745-1866(-)
MTSVLLHYSNFLLLLDYRSLLQVVHVGEQACCVHVQDGILLGSADGPLLLWAPAVVNRLVDRPDLRAVGAAQPNAWMHLGEPGRADVLLQGDGAHWGTEPHLGGTALRHVSQLRPDVGVDVKGRPEALGVGQHGLPVLARPLEPPLPCRVLGQRVRGDALGAHSVDVLQVVLEVVTRDFSQQWEGLVVRRAQLTNWISHMADLVASCDHADQHIDGVALLCGVIHALPNMWVVLHENVLHTVLEQQPLGGLHDLRLVTLHVNLHEQYVLVHHVVQGLSGHLHPVANVVRVQVLAFNAGCAQHTSLWHSDAQCCALLIADDVWPHVDEMSNLVHGYSPLEKGTELGHRLPCYHPATHSGCIEGEVPEVGPHIQD